MVNKSFEAYKLARELKRSGTEYEFKRPGKNKFNEPSKELSSIGKLKGLYHEQSSSIQITTGDTTQTRTKKLPMILCLYKDVASLALNVGDIVAINSKIFKVTGIINVQEWNIITDISLEVVDSVIQT